MGNGDHTFEARGADSETNGKINTDDIVNGMPLTFHPAAAGCAQMQFAGFYDWYLPAVLEIQSTLYIHRNSIAGISNLGTYWTSIEAPGAQDDNAQALNFSTPAVNNLDKESERLVRCIRRL